MSNQNDNYISFEKALRDLQMQSEQLKRLVSEGEIRAFRDGDSMKFKREDLDALRGSDEDEAEELVFEESLEDDTGMVTEELSDEDTLLAEDDLDDEPAPATVPAKPRATRAAAPSPQRARAARAREEEADDSTPTWVTAGLILTTALMFYAVTIMFTVSSSAMPAGGGAQELGAASDPLGIFEPRNAAGAER